MTYKNKLFTKVIKTKIIKKNNRKDNVKAFSNSLFISFDCKKNWSNKKCKFFWIFKDRYICKINF